MKTATQLRTRWRELMDAAKAGRLTTAARRELNAINAQLRKIRRPAANARRPTAAQEVAGRLALIADMFESGVGEMTGKVRREAGREGEIIGRFGGVKKSFPELRHISDSPKTIAAAIRKGTGAVYRRVHQAVAADVARSRPDRKATAGRKTVAPHPGRVYCVHCRDYHTKGQHTHHGEGAFHRTHLFSFNQGGHKFVLRDDSDGAYFTGSPKHGRPAFSRDERQAVFFDTPERAREVAELLQIPTLRVMVRVTKGPRRPPVPRRNARKKTGRRLIRMGRLVELRYERDHGAQPGYYKHEFKTRPPVFFDPSSNTVVIRGGK